MLARMKAAPRKFHKVSSDPAMPQRAPKAELIAEAKKHGVELPEPDRTWEQQACHVQAKSQ
jgi:hypothetical protein